MTNNYQNISATVFKKVNKHTDN